MSEILIAITILLSITGSVRIYKSTKEAVSIVFFIPVIVFFCLRPLLYLISGFKAPYVHQISGTDLFTYQISGVIFCVTAIIFFPRFYKIPYERLFESKSAERVFGNSSSFKPLILILFFSTISYIANTLRFHSFTYPLESHNHFAAMMDLAGSSYYLNYLSEALLIPILLGLGRASRSNNKIKLATYLLITCTIYVFIGAPSTRSWAIIILATIIFSNHTRLGFKTLAPCLLTLPLLPIILYIFNQLRQNIPIDWSETLYNSYSSLYINFLQFENSILLIQKLKSHEWFYFSQLLPALTPLIAIPSAIFPWKPAMDKDAQLTDLIFGKFGLDNSIYAEGSTLTYTVPMSGYADLGYIGVFISSLVFIWLASLYLRLASCNWTRVLMIFLFIRTTLGFRVAAEANFAFAYFLMAMLVPITIFVRLTLTRHRLKNE
ncbi:O-antigen polysaccharide polymerase Wzy [Pseudomonas sp. PDM22]|uniref:O-antigen polysaccharide polymerase Wzy n=1 Tax=Pseudomonas sp. PDM22 TaxID=2769287 RepID=UPI0009DA7708|nr:O-antigen polysaccharide polymerase Wzy [Pseudomonas sp. PDM22]MBD9514023.1 O-antigen polysaccharide polymerase Wzy [Pseudomonas sp. PDM22]OQR35045.1 hypothetical protein BWR15_13945 [Pseudomonas sp. T]